MSSEYWLDLPEPTRDAVQRHCGPIVAVDHQPIGLHSEFSATLTTETGRVFVKGSRLTSSHRWMHRNEARINRFLPALAPRVLWVVESGGWLLHGFEHAAGRHARLGPGSSDLPLVATSVARMHRTLTPCPDPDAGSFAGQWDRLSAWRRLRDDPPSDLHPWTAEHLHSFAGLESQAIAAVDGDSLVHTDLHELNILIDESARVIDWAWARRAAGWVDAAFLVIRLVDAGHSPRAAEEWAATLPVWQNAPAEELSLFAGEVLGVWELLQHRQPLPHRTRLTDAARTWACHRRAMIVGPPWRLSRDRHS